MKNIIKPKTTVLETLGIEVVKIDENESIVSVNIDERHHQHLGLVHGGIYVLLAETAASIAGACSLSEYGQSVVGLEINANHLKSCKEGQIRASSKRLHKGHQTLVYEVRVENQDNKLISIARCTLMIVRHE